MNGDQRMERLGSTGLMASMMEQIWDGEQRTITKTHIQMIHRRDPLTSNARLYPRGILLHPSSLHHASSGESCRQVRAVVPRQASHSAYSLTPHFIPRFKRELWAEKEK